MHARWIRWVGLCAACLVASAVFSQIEQLRSPRNASYTIDVALDTEARRLTGSQVLTWRNIQELPTDELRFHLYWNAFRNDRSTWLLEDRVGGRDRRPELEDADGWGWIEVDSTTLLPGDDPIGGGEAIDLTNGMRFESPDDGNPHDRTVLVVPLPQPVEPGRTIRIQMQWRAQIPRDFDRTGFRGNFYFFAHWFPKLGVYEADGWNCYQYHASTEYFSDYGIYDVTMTVPRGFVLGATGRELERRDNDDGTTTHRYFQEDVHAFTWTTSPYFQVREERFAEPGLPPVNMRLLIQPEHLGQVNRHFAATRAAIEHYGKWYGPYTYGHVTVVDPAYGSSSGGMEYPTLFTAGTRLFNPLASGSPESVTIHEMGHQYWYGLVGNNEFEDAWMDEGLNTFSTIRTQTKVYGENSLVRRYLSPPGGGRGYLPFVFYQIQVPPFHRRMDAYRRTATDDDPFVPTFRYHPMTGYNVSYSKTALWLATLEGYLGWDTLQEILHTFFERYRFGHPDPEDLFAIAEDISGRDLSWFFDQVHYGSHHFDYAIDSVATLPAEPEGWVEQDGELVYVERVDEDEEGFDDEDKERIYRSEVVVRRLGGGVFPVDVLLVFEDGTEIRRHWDGMLRWTQFVEERNSKLSHAIVDPDRVLMLDIQPSNNSLLVEPDPVLPAAKWASKWMIWLQDLMSNMSFFL
jgi:hypothetical protein